MKRFWDKVNKRSGRFGIDGTFPTECWEWTSATWGKGYGLFKLNGKNVCAHRLSWEWAYGPIGDLLVLHKCDNRPCIRPDHLFLGTYADNMWDKVHKGRAKGGAIGENNQGAKSSEKDILRIRQLHESGCLRSELAKEFNLSESNINKIVYRYTWKHI